MEPRISIVTIAVDDLDRATRFYEAMGLIRHAGITDGVTFFQMGGVILGLFPRESAEADSGITFGTAPSAVYLAYNTRSDTEVDDVLAMAEKAGGRIVKPAGRAFWGGWYGYFADTEGHVWEVAHNPAFPIAEDGSISLPG
ncbi:MAG: VOC family protein [Mesorhizobium sp.]|uniref:VOC family protein n=1 Tax=unclassified Mesorhizobium TaxID=325217 RepID=UPI000FCBD1F0|nr:MULTISPECIES: VOC family protein [unclassified Mesorhizobium]RUV68054.1 VOC family protein [Mesorhizobium sp. M5C.F.Cr.IN.023.01.1.1]RWB33130.1 MAG: VOC family protein [Mesorhizobium sp.]RWB62420.1 MAG: VOC family protein [Mesorhizobium sp.]RWC24919.1 MAG: VOC family protein [Mesorhizobium sp.]RWD43039.1 MAG: VOC family protein [Mesorhizobium sp.]